MYSPCKRTRNLYEHLSVDNLLSEHQFGFRKYNSTASALLDCRNDWYINMDRKFFNLVVFIDLKKGFNSVDHEILLEKLLLFGVTDGSFQLLKSYLCDRSQKCEVNGVVSKGNTVKCSVPLGSILRMLFFLLYINDLPSCLNPTKPLMFADDTNITSFGKCINEVDGSWQAN